MGQAEKPEPQQEIQSPVSGPGERPQTEMPRYKCHKEVWALKIAEIRPVTLPKPTIAELEKILNSADEETVEILPNGAVVSASAGAEIVPADEGYAPFHIDGAYLRKHNPKPGGYYVVYKDGYKSFSPADAFEGGYTRVQS
jgi:hypothetical protein